jgi:hypothetical protein
MVNGLKFPSRVATLKPRGTLERSVSGCVDWPLKGVGTLKMPRPDQERAGQPKRNLRGVDRQEKLSGELQDVRTGNRHRWVRRAASGERVKRGQGTRHNDPVTSEEGMSTRVKGLPRSLGGSQ